MMAAHQNAHKLLQCKELRLPVAKTPQVRANQSCTIVQQQTVLEEISQSFKTDFYKNLYKHSRLYEIAFCYCNCHYILFTKLPGPGHSEGTFRSSSQAATCPPVYHTRRRLYTVP